MEVKPLKHIINHETLVFEKSFSANKVKYYIRTPEEGIGLYRWRLFSSKFLPLIGYDTTLGQLRAFNQQMLSEMNNLGTGKWQPAKVFEALGNFDEAINRTQRNWDYSIMAATLIIVKENENLDIWTEAHAEEKILNWRKAGIHEADFFFLTMWWAAQFSTELTNLRQKMHKRLTPPQ